MTDFNPPAPEGFVVHEGDGSVDDCLKCAAGPMLSAECKAFTSTCSDIRPDGRWVYFTRAEPAKES